MAVAVAVAVSRGVAVPCGCASGCACGRPHKKIFESKRSLNLCLGLYVCASSRAQTLKCSTAISVTHLVCESAILSISIYILVQAIWVYMIIQIAQQIYR